MWALELVYHNNSWEESIAGAASAFKLYNNFPFSYVTIQKGPARYWKLEDICNNYFLFRHLKLSKNSLFLKRKKEKKKKKRKKKGNAKENKTKNFFGNWLFHSILVYLFLFFGFAFILLKSFAASQKEKKIDASWCLHHVLLWEYRWQEEKVQDNLLYIPSNINRKKKTQEKHGSEPKNSALNYCWSVSSFPLFLSLYFSLFHPLRILKKNKETKNPSSSSVSSYLFGFVLI